MSSLDSGKIHGSEFRNEYLDDSAWWGIAWLKFHERTKDVRYLRTAIAIHRHMAANWRKDGGVSWADEAGKRDANAITNSLFVILSARLHRVTGQQEYLEWAERTHAWQEQKKLYDGTAIVDRPGHVGDYWTYNQGAYLGGLEAMHATTGEVAYLDKAAQVASTILDRSGIVRSDSILFEKLGRGGWDCSLFKGICARYFGVLSRSLKRREIHMDVAARLDSVLHASAVSILKTSKKDELYPLEWHQPPRSLTSNYNTQLSALMAFCAVVEPT
jgi:predicted alpha-1,6-mannanase (GH76 family)